MEVTLLGTGSPIPLVERAGTSLVVETDGARFLVDCGPRTVTELLRNEIDPGSIADLFLTHHHIDHNAAFFHLVVTGWTAGRESLTVYGPDGTDRLIDAFFSVYEEDLAYRSRVGYDIEHVRDLEWVPVEAGFRVRLAGVTVDALPVEHSIETYAYRFEDATGSLLVFSGDTARLDRLAEFAADADVLVHDAHLAPVGEPPTDGFVWDRYTRPYPQEAVEVLSKTHATPAEAGEVAAAANADCLVLTHFPPYRDEAAVSEAARAVFEGEVHVATDGLRLPVGEQANGP